MGRQTLLFHLSQSITNFLTLYQILVTKSHKSIGKTLNIIAIVNALSHKRPETKNNLWLKLIDTTYKPTIDAGFNGGAQGEKRK